MGTGDGEMWILRGVDITEVSLYVKLSQFTLRFARVLAQAAPRVGQDGRERRGR